MSKFKPVQRVYIIESSIFIKEVEIVKYSAGFYVIKYPNTNQGFKVRESRIFVTKNAAESSIKSNRY